MSLRQRGRCQEHHPEGTWDVQRTRLPSDGTGRRPGVGEAHREVRRPLLGEGEARLVDGTRRESSRVMVPGPREGPPSGEGRGDLQQISGDPAPRRGAPGRRGPGSRPHPCSSLHPRGAAEVAPPRPVFRRDHSGPWSNPLEDRRRSRSRPLIPEPAHLLPGYLEPRVPSPRLTRKSRNPRRTAISALLPGPNSSGDGVPCGILEKQAMAGLFQSEVQEAAQIPDLGLAQPRGAGPGVPHSRGRLQSGRNSAMSPCARRRWR